MENEILNEMDDFEAALQEDVAQDETEEVLTDAAEGEPEDAAEDKAEDEPTPAAAPFTLGGRALDAQAVSVLSQTLGGTPQAFMELLTRGMEYDQKNAREIEVLTQYAQASGVSLPQYITMLENGRNEARLNAEMQALAQTLPEGTPDEALRLLAEKNIGERTRIDRVTQDARKAATHADKANAKQEAQKVGWQRVLASHPDLKRFEDVPQEVLQAMSAGGLTPLEAYGQHELNQARAQLEKLETELAAARKNEQNRGVGLGSMRGESSGEGDAFLAALLGG